MGLMTLLAEQSWLPDRLKRWGIRHLLRQRIAELQKRDAETNERDMVASLSRQPVALHVDQANQQHYEVPAAFFEQVLGRHLKYSGCFWGSGIATLDEAEEAMLQLTVQRAELASGQEILELGCGWGSLTLFMAAQFPDARITAVSNSASQRLFIEEKAKQRGLTNVKVLTCDMNHFHTEGQFDRVVSVEMFEHMRNYQELLKRISLWLKPTGLLFVHIFTHHSHTYAFESQGRDGDWMSDYFFTGGLMPGAQLLPRFQRDLTVIRQDTVNGIHYQKTARAWLDRFDDHRNQILPIMASVYGKKEAVRWSERWRLFFMACEECFGYNSGREWPVHHYLFRKVESGGSKE